MTNGYNTPIGVPIGLPSILSLGLPPLVNPYPTLNLDFIENPQFDSRITFSRGSQATLFDSTGTLVYAKHNLLLQSQTFQTTWINTNSSEQTDVEVAPDGTTTADKLVEDTAAGAHAITQTSVSFAAFTYTASVYLKAAGRSFARIIIQDGASAFFTAYFNLSTGAVGNLSGTGTVASTINVGNGWYRCLVTAPLAAGTGSVAIRAATANGTDSYTGDGTSGIFIWGAQLNLANMEGGVTSSLTTYYPTTTAAYYAPRFDYNPSTLQPRGLLIEEQRTNSLLQSQDFTTTWVAGASTTVTANAATAPDGTVTADRLQLPATSGTFVRQSFSALATTTYTISVFARSLSGTSDFALSFSTFASTTQTATTSWQRFTFTFTTVGAVSDFISINNGNDSYATDIYIWGAQLEAGAFATSYIPTTTTALTRNADVASMTGTNFSSWYNASEGTLFAIGSVQRGFREIVGVSEGVGNNRIVIQTGSSSGQRIIVTTLGVQQALQSGSYTLGQTGKFAAAYATNSAIISVNGGISTEGTSVTVPTVTTLNIGNTSNSTGQISGYIQRLAYYPTRLPDATLQALTA